MVEWLGTDLLPGAMGNRVPEIPMKAIEIANALLEEAMKTAWQSRIAIAKSKEWVSRGGR